MPRASSAIEGALGRTDTYWPRDPYLELSPRDWARTRATLDLAELVPEVGPITVPPVASR
jgi:hypothetical protein